MPSSTILSDNGVSSGTSGIKTSGGNDGLLLLQTTTAGGTATTAVTIDTSQNATFAGTVAHPLGSVSAPSVTFTGDTNTGIYSSAADTVDIATGGTQRGQFDSSGNFKFNSGYGSVATAYGCRAWVNFNGTGTVAIRASGNVTSITDNGVGLYQVNFTNALVDANFAVVITGGGQGASGSSYAVDAGSATTAKVNIRSRAVSGGAAVDEDPFSVSVFR